MDKKKSNVVKSKSSNSAITSKSDRAKSPKNTKPRSMSSAAFQPRLHPRFERKRGVYVEKKATKLSINEGKEPNKLAKPPPRPKRNQKRFLASVLTILSKCTTSTQYPDAIEPTKIERDKNRKVKKQTVPTPTVEIVEKGIQPEELQIVEPNDTTIKHQKYRSRILNDVFRDKDPLVVLKERRDIIQTPSNNSQRSYRDNTDSNRFLDIHPIINYEEKGTKVQRRVSLDIGAVEDYTEKINKKENKLQSNREPATLVSENTNKEEKGLYNFFVDVLETTFNMYNVTDGSATTPFSGECSKVKFEIDETVAKKLEVPTGDAEETTRHECWHDPVRSYNVLDGTRAASPSPSNMRCPRNRSPKSKSPGTVSPKSCRSPRTRSPGTRSPVSKASRSPARSYQKMFPANKSLTYAQQFKVESPKAQRLVMPKRPVSRKHKKQSFLNSLKEQLRMDNDEYDEPRNLYEALKVIAQNKRKCRRSIQFDSCVKFTANEPDSECWRRRRVISSSGNSTKRNRRFFDDRDFLQSLRTSSIMRSSASNSSGTTRNASRFSKSKSVYTTEPELDESFHSIEVQGFDYETAPKLRRNVARLNRIRTVNKPVVIPKSSDTSSLEYDFGSRDAMFKFAESVAISLAYNRDNDGVYKSISQIMLGD